MHRSAIFLFLMKGWQTEWTKCIYQLSQHQQASFVHLAHLFHIYNNYSFVLFMDCKVPVHSTLVGYHSNSDSKYGMYSINISNQWYAPSQPSTTVFKKQEKAVKAVRCFALVNLSEKSKSVHRQWQQFVYLKDLFLNKTPLGQKSVPVQWEHGLIHTTRHERLWRYWLSKTKYFQQNRQHVLCVYKLNNISLLLQLLKTWWKRQKNKVKNLLNYIVIIFFSDIFTWMHLLCHRTRWLLHFTAVVVHHIWCFVYFFLSQPLLIYLRHYAAAVSPDLSSYWLHHGLEDERVWRGQ